MGQYFQNQQLGQQAGVPQSGFTLMDLFSQLQNIPGLGGAQQAGFNPLMQQGSLQPPPIGGLLPQGGAFPSPQPIVGTPAFPTPPQLQLPPTAAPQAQAATQQRPAGAGAIGQPTANTNSLGGLSVLPGGRTLRDTR